MKLNFKERKKQAKGITLIALVITIVVLLILAGVTIATLTGDNGILKQADKAKTETTMGEEKEAIGLAYNGAKTEKLGGEITAADLNTQFTKNGTKATASGEGTIKVDFETERSYTVDAHGTIEKFDDISNHLKVGDYVNYSDKNGNKILCKVLYNNDNYGVELVSVNPVDAVTLGFDDPTIPSSMDSEDNFEKSKYSYNNAIKTLNDKAEEYRNPAYSAVGGARCVGSVPGDPYSEANSFFSFDERYFRRYNGIFKNFDYNYSKDRDQLDYIGSNTLKEDSIYTGYWLASRDISAGIYGARLCVNVTKPNGWLRDDCLFYVGEEEGPKAKSATEGFRPVFRLNPYVKLDDGDGKDGATEGSAYDLR